MTKVGRRKANLRSRRRSARMTLGTLAAVLGVAVSVGGLAFPAGASAAIGKLRCHPTTVHTKGICVLAFTDSAKRSGRTVCFSTALPNRVSTVKGPCATTGKGGRADGIFRAVQKGTATVTATESFNGQTLNTVSVSILVVRS